VIEKQQHLTQRTPKNALGSFFYPFGGIFLLTESNKEGIVEPSERTEMEHENLIGVWFQEYHNQIDLME
jgi:hypothetical protein